MKKIDTVLWDLDGTLLCTLTDLAASVNYALAQNHMPIRTEEEVKSFVGNGIRLLMERAVPDGKANPTFDKAFADFQAHYAVNCNNSTKPYDGIPALLQKLKQRGCKMAVVSNKIDSAVKDLVQIYFADTITFAVGDNPQRAKKPAPDNVLFALEQLGSSPENAVYIGDSEVDIMTAQNAGLPMIIVDWGYKTKEFLEQKGAENIVSTPEQLLKIFNGLSTC